MSPSENWSVKSKAMIPSAVGECSFMGWWNFNYEEGETQVHSPLFKDVVYVPKNVSVGIGGPRRGRKSPRRAKATKRWLPSDSAIADSPTIVVKWLSSMVWVGFRMRFGVLQDSPQCRLLKGDDKSAEKQSSSRPAFAPSWPQCNNYYGSERPHDECKTPARQSAAYLKQPILNLRASHCPSYDTNTSRWQDRRLAWSKVSKAINFLVSLSQFLRYPLSASAPGYFWTSKTPGVYWIFWTPIVSDLGLGILKLPASVTRYQWPVHRVHSGLFTRSYY